MNTMYTYIVHSVSCRLYNAAKTYLVHKYQDTGALSVGPKVFFISIYYHTIITMIFTLLADIVPSPSYHS